MRNIPETLNAWATWSDLQQSSFSLLLLPGWLRGRHRQLVFCPYCWPSETTQADSFALNSGHIFYAFILLKTWTHLSKLNVEAGSMGCISDQVYRLLIQSNQKGGPYLNQSKNASTRISGYHSSSHPQVWYKNHKSQTLFSDPLHIWDFANWFSANNYHKHVALKSDYKKRTN